MASKTRLGIAVLVENGIGSVTLPEEVTLFCPQCGAEAADKGQCSIEFAKIPGESKTGFVLKIIVNCRGCSYHGFDPGVDF